MISTQDIEDKIERTRSEMTDTLQAIERKLSPNRLMDEAMETMRSASWNESRVMELVRDNPVPLALVGLGVGWLVLSSVRTPRAAVEASAEPTSAELDQNWADEVEDDRQAVVDGTQKFISAAQARARRLGHRMEQVTRTVRRRAGNMADSTGEVFQQHPLTVGLLAVVAGVAIGAVIPRSRQEANVLGAAADGLLDSARETGRVVLQRAGRAVQAAVAEGGAKLTGEGGAMTTH